METYIIGGWMLVMTTVGMPPIVDVNYSSEQACEQVKADLVPQYPNYTITCMGAWKADKTRQIRRKAHYRRYARRR